MSVGSVETVGGERRQRTAAPQRVSAPVRHVLLVTFVERISGSCGDEHSQAFTVAGGEPRRRQGRTPIQVSYCGVAPGDGYV